MNSLVAIALMIAPPIQTPRAIDVPAATDDRLVIELVASEPEIVTPTGVAVDQDGRIWVVENQTHHRTADYQGPAGDRIRIYDDFQSNGRAGRVRTFAEGFKDAMSLAIAPQGDVYLATRSQILILRDADDDGVSDGQDVIVRLETAGDYPHNGLAGFAFDALDNVYFGFGENLGADYQLIGSDGRALSGGGEGGNIYRCRPDGSGLIRVATGFWNPFHMALDEYGRLFAVDNDPDSRPPCRLLHIISGGDYGYRFRNGRRGLHPFTAWNGELPGTLPMAAGTGEAPSGIVAYESDGLPPEYIGNLLVTSWGDHVIQRFQLVERGASFTSQPEAMVRGGDSFYPVGIAVAPDGSLVVSDWADKSYPVHGKGRIWRIRMKDPAGAGELQPNGVRAMADSDRLLQLLGHSKRELRHAAGVGLARLAGQNAAGAAEQIVAKLQAICTDERSDPRTAMHALWSLARIGPHAMPQNLFHLARAPLAAESIRLAAELSSPPNTPVWERELLKVLPREQEVLAVVRLEAILAARSPQVLKAVVPYLADGDPFLRSAAIESVARSSDVRWLQQIGEDGDAAVRLGSLLAMRRSGLPGARDRIADFLTDPDPEIRRTAIQWVGEERLTEHRSRLATAVSAGPVTRPLFEAYLAAADLLAGIARKPTDEPSGEEFIARVLNDDSQPVALRALAVRTIRPDHPALAIDRVSRMFDAGDPGIRLELVRTLSLRADEPAQQMLRRVASDKQADQVVRLQAIAGLGHSAQSDPTAKLLVALLDEDDEQLRRESLRSLRAAGARRDVAQPIALRLKARDRLSAAERELAEMIVRKNGDSDAKRTKGSTIPAGVESTNRGDPAVGERVFFHASGPQCFACHRVNGRGGAAGPDLSVIGRSLDIEKMVRSIVEPSKDIAPQFTPWLFSLKDGRVLSGIILEDDPRGILRVGDPDGKTIELSASDVVERKASDRSIMPDDLMARMTASEFQDLIAFLRDQK